jgi:hypothetical protein
LHSKDVVSTRQCDTTVLLDVNGGWYYTLNEVGGRIWELVGEKATVAEIVDRLNGEFDASAERLATDTSAMLERLLEAGLVERSER